MFHHVPHPTESRLLTDFYRANPRTLVERYHPLQKPYDFDEVHISRLMSPGQPYSYYVHLLTAHHLLRRYDTRTVKFIENSRIQPYCTAASIALAATPPFMKPYFKTMDLMDRYPGIFVDFVTLKKSYVFYDVEQFEWDMCDPPQPWVTSSLYAFFGGKLTYDFGFQNIQNYLVPILYCFDQVKKPEFCKPWDCFIMARVLLDHHLKEENYLIYDGRSKLTSSQKTCYRIDKLLMVLKCLEVSLRCIESTSNTEILSFLYELLKGDISFFKETPIAQRLIANAVDGWLSDGLFKDPKIKMKVYCQLAILKDRFVGKISLDVMTAYTEKVLSFRHPVETDVPEPKPSLRILNSP